MRIMAQYSKHLFLAGFIALLLSSAALAENVLRNIDLEIAIDGAAPVNAVQTWFEPLKKLGLGGLRARRATGGETPEITAKRALPGREKVAKRYKVVALLTGGNRLALPGRTFQTRDMAALKQYLIKVAEEGANAPTARRGAFGLTKKQFASVHSDLSQVIAEKTKGVSLAKFLESNSKSLSYKISVPPQTAAAIQKAKITDELQGFSAGMILSIALREQNLALQPTLDHGKLIYRVVSFDGVTRDKEKSDAPTVWPVGYKPEGTTRQVLPVLMESLQVEIAGHTLAEALDALHGRIKKPFLFDHAALTEQKIDPKKVQVRFPLRRTIYISVLKNIVFQAKLKGDLRVDENGEVFYWMTTRKRLSR